MAYLALLAEFERELDYARWYLRDTKMNFDETLEYLDELKKKHQTRWVTKEIRIWTGYLNYRYIEYSEAAANLQEVWKTKPNKPPPDI